ncbi:glycoside hydrolase family 76 protein [Kribbia dieselivorans]|uniref:glycoside hydrolase family 76 protein n=1 Tax=Kribbia dieselivorans TaxID=331526 RepID=UPI001FE09C39|nr:glycoside hydrolase family 76 protein [Kribbia dieselivorans]
MPDSPSARRAAHAAQSVVRAHGGRLWRLPGTHLAAPTRPRSDAFGPWHYWWQAHYLDCLVDAGWRALHTHGATITRDVAHTADALLRTMWLRNGLRYVNPYYDDMAWLLLATARLDALHQAIEHVSDRRIRTVRSVLNAQLESAHTADHGGGLWWHAVRDFKNVPATAPAAIHFARTGQSERATELIEWMYAHLQDPQTGLFFDGLRERDGAQYIERNIYTYNQGTVLGALLALGRSTDVTRAEQLIADIVTHLTGAGATLITHGSGDQGLFTGILARYLALAATDERISVTARSQARASVLATADALWAGRAARGRWWVFPADSGATVGEASIALPIELSTQLQAWMTLEAAHLVTVDARVA